MNRYQIYYQQGHTGPEFLLADSYHFSSASEPGFMDDRVTFYRGTGKLVSATVQRVDHVVMVANPISDLSVISTKN